MSVVYISEGCLHTCLGSVMPVAHLKGECWSVHHGCVGVGRLTVVGGNLGFFFHDGVRYQQSRKVL